MSKIKKTSAVYESGRTTIPKKIREALDVEDGDIIAWEDDGEKVVVKRFPFPE